MLTPPTNIVMEFPSPPPKQLEPPILRIDPVLPQSIPEVPTATATATDSPVPETTATATATPTPVIVPSPEPAPGPKALFPALKADTVMQASVRDALSYAWGCYKKYAWGSDNLRPISKSSSNGFLSTRFLHIVLTPLPVPRSLSFSLALSFSLFLSFSLAHPIPSSLSSSPSLSLRMSGAQAWVRLWLMPSIHLSLPG